MFGIFRINEPSKIVRITRTRMIVGLAEYYWRDILTIELQYRHGTTRLVLMLCAGALCVLIVVGEHYWLFLTVSLWIFPFLVLLKLTQPQPDILIRYRGRDSKIKTVYPLSENNIVMTRKQIEQFYVAIKKAHAERG